MIAQFIGIYLAIGFVISLFMDELHHSGWDFIARWLFWPIFFIMYIGKSLFRLTDEVWDD
jgi:hypothetical protein